MAQGRSVLVLLSARGGGDRPPVIALARGLQDRGDRVTILCDSVTERLVASTGLPTVSYPADLEKRGHVTRWFGTLDAEDSGQNSDAPNPLTEWPEDVLPFSRAQMADTKPDLIIATLFCMGFAETLAAELGVPWCFVNPSFYFGDHAATTYEEDWYGPFIPRLARDVFLPLARRADIVLHATDPLFDFEPSEMPPKHHFVSFLQWEPPGAAPAVFSQAGDPWVLVTSSTEPQEDEITWVRAALEALSEHPVRVLLTFPDKQARQHLGEIPANTTVAEFVPHSPVLEQCILAVSHAGHGLVSKALYYGVPMVLVPWDRDQPGVASRAEALGVAAIVPRADISAGAVKRAVAAVFDEPKYQEAAASVSARLKETDSVEAACRLLAAL